MNTAYKHLDAKLKIAEMTVGQWAGLFAGLLLGLGYAFYLHPLGPTFTMFTGVYIAGLPIGAVFLTGLAEFDLWGLVGDAIRHRREDGRYLAGPGRPTAGYALTDARRPETGPDPIVELDRDALWGTR